MKQFSKNTIRLLRVFYSHPEQQFYIQELGRILKKKPGVFQRALYNLEKEGVLKSDYKANARFFSANKDYPFYSEFKSILHKMSRLAVIIFILGAFLLPLNNVFCEEKNTDTLALGSLTEAVNIAFRRNKDIQIQEYALKVASSDILYARSNFLPKVDFNAAYTHNGSVASSTSAYTKKDPGIFYGYKNDNMAGISVNDTIYNGGDNIATLRQAQLGLKEQIETLRATKLNVELETKRLYYGLLLAYETMRIAQDLVTQAESHYRQVEQKFKQGTSSRFDLLQ